MRRDFFLHQIEIAQRLFELLALVRVFDRETQARLGSARATRAESRPAKIQNRERDAQTFA